MPHNSYLVHATRTSIDEICTTAKFVLHCQFVMPSMRIDRAFIINADSDASVAMATRIGSQNGVLPPRALLVTLADETSVDAWLAQSTVLPCPETTHFVAAKAANDGKRVLIELADGVDWIVARRVALWAAALPATHWVEPLARSVALHNLLATGVVYNGPTTGNTPQITPQFSGQGVTVGVVDTGVDRQSCYFANGKITGYKAVSGGDETDASDGHGTAMAGTCCGNGGPQVGVARDASVFVVDIAAGGTVLPDVDIKAALEAAKAGGATVVVIAFGDNDEKWYPAVAADIDAFAAANPEILPVVAAGNRGYLGVPAVAGPAHAKNALVVGATQSALESFLAHQRRRLAACCSRGRSSTAPASARASSSAFSSRGPTSRRPPQARRRRAGREREERGARRLRRQGGQGHQRRRRRRRRRRRQRHAVPQDRRAPTMPVTRRARSRRCSCTRRRSRSTPPSRPTPRRPSACIGAGRWPSDTYGFGAVALDYVIARQGAAAPAFAIKLVEGEVGAGETEPPLLQRRRRRHVPRHARLDRRRRLADGRQRARQRPQPRRLARQPTASSGAATWPRSTTAVNNVEAVRFEVASAGGQYGVAVTGNRRCSRASRRTRSSSPAPASPRRRAAPSARSTAARPTATASAASACAPAARRAPTAARSAARATAAATASATRRPASARAAAAGPATSCTTAAPPQTTIVTTVNRHVIDTGISTGLFAGLLVLGYFVGCFCFLFLGGFIGARLMKAKRDRQTRR
jgi:hypothetical protein